MSKFATAPKFVEMEISTNTNTTNSNGLDVSRLLTKEEEQDFNAKFNDIVKDLTEVSDFRDMDDTNKWLGRVMKYNVPHGKKNRGLSTVVAYKFMAKELTPENMERAYVLGWCNEMLQAYFLVSDDIMDHSQTRRGQPCWYKVDNLGAAAFNDACLIESSIYVLLAKYFRTTDYYADLLEIMHNATHVTVYGQSLDTRTGLERKMENYTMDLYSSIVKYKTSFYTFTLPVFSAMAMVGLINPELRNQAKIVTTEIGHFFQVQDDFLDCFGDESVTGKMGTDIQDCKCSWLFVMALQRVNEKQRTLLLANYGQNDMSKVQIVKNLYNELELQQVYKNYEEKTYNAVMEHINQMSPGLPKGLFVDMIQKIYQRKA